MPIWLNDSVWEMISNLYGCPELSRKPRVCKSLPELFMFATRCVGASEVKFGSASGDGDRPGFLELIRLVQSISKLTSPECYMITDATSINECMELLDSFIATAVEPGNDLWSFVEFSDQD